MAFKGGFLVKPTTTNTQNLANLLIQGTQAIEEKKLKINESASKLMSEFNKSMTEMPITGPADYNVFISKTSDAIRGYTSSLYQKFLKGEISINDLNIGMSKATGQATMLANSQEVSAKQNEELQKGISEGKYSGINSVLNFGIFRAAATGDNNESILNTTVDEFGDIQLSYSYLMPTTEGAKSMTKTASLSNRLAPATGFIPYKAVDLNKDIKSFLETTGSAGLISTSQEDILDREGLPTGDKMDIIKIDPSKSDKVKSAIELTVNNSYSSNDLVDIAHQMGMKIDMDPTYKPYTQEILDSKFGLSPLTTATGEDISISPEDMLLETSDDGLRVKLTEKQEKIVRGYLRQKLYNALKVDQKTFINRAPDTDKAVNKTKALNAKLSSAKTALGGHPESPLVSSAIGDFALNQFNSFQELILGTKIQDAGDLATREIPEGIKQLIITQTEGSSTHTAIAVPEELGSVIKDAMIPVSFTGQKLNSVNNIYAQRREDKDGKVKYNIVLVGSSNIGSQEMGGTRTDDKPYTTARVSKTIENALTLPQSEASMQKLYQTLWDTNLDFQNAAKTAMPPLSRNSKNYGMAIYQTLQNIQ